MATKIFLTGATGYIGGETLYQLVEAHPEYELTLLVRNEERGKPVAAAYPKARLVYGSLDSADVIEREAAAADIVIHTADSSDDQPSARAIAKGLAAGHSAERPGYWIHLCGTGILTWYDLAHSRFGEAPLAEQAYDDIGSISEILSLPRDAPHRDVDEIVLGASAAGYPAVRTLIFCPPTIYGRGRGPVNQRSVQVPRIVEYALQRGFAPVQGAGLSEWDNVHIRDVGAFFVRAVAAALDPATRDDPEVFGPRAYFFLENGDRHKWSDVARWVADEAARRGLLPEPAVKTVDDVPSLGTNSRGVASRARKYFGWEPRGPSLKDEIPDAVTVEAERLGKV